MEKVERLVEIWQNIPQADNKKIDLSQNEIISQYVDLFHIGEFFHLIFNTQKADMEYVSPKIRTILGYEASEFNMQLVLENIHPEDVPYYYHYEESAVRFFTALPPDQLSNYKFSYDYRIKSKNGSYKRILQQVIPVYYFADGGARTLGIFTDIDHLGIGGIPKLSFIGMNGAPSYYNYHQKEIFQKADKLFTPREMEILAEVIQGVSSSEIAKKLNLSVYTVQTHRKNILKKSGCANLTELLTKAVREGWV